VDPKNDMPKTHETRNARRMMEVELFFVMNKRSNIATLNGLGIIDSGVLEHMTSHNNWYTSLHPTRDELNVSLEIHQSVL